MPSIKPSNRPNAIVCKFVREPAKDQVMAARKKVGGLKAEELGFAADVNVKYLNIHDHFTPRLQALYHEAEKVKEAIRSTNFVGRKMALCIFASLKNPQFTNSPTFLSLTRNLARPQKLE